MADGTGEASEQGGRPPKGAPAAPVAVLCDDGELEDVYQALLGIGGSLLRVRPADLAQLETWERPRRLFVSGVRTALAPPGPGSLVGKGVVSIAVADQATNTLCATLLRRGYRYVIRRPVHPEALRLLLRQVLFAGREQRHVARFPFGGVVRWRRGLRRGRCPMTEISPSGCRILTNERFAVGDRVHLRVPSALRDGRSIRLRGRVVRRDLGDPSVRPRRAQVALAFQDLSARAQADLDALLAERASGPAPLRAGDLPDLAPIATSAPAAPEPAPANAGEAAGPRRRRPRGQWREEVVALDPVAAQAVDTLLGRDLSSRGMRVEPHPTLQLGDALKVALYDPGASGPLVLDARVVRDDGRRGLALVFEDVDPARLAQLERMVAALPPVSVLSDEDEKLESVVLGGLLLVKTSAVVPL